MSYVCYRTDGIDLLAQNKGLIASSMTERLPGDITNHLTTSQKEILTMKTNPKSKSPERALQTKSLGGLLEQSEDIKDLVEECV